MDRIKMKLFDGPYIIGRRLYIKIMIKNIRVPTHACLCNFAYFYYHWK